MKLDYVVVVGRRVKLEHFGGMILGARSIGNDVVIRQNTTFGIVSAEDMNAKPIIDDGVDLGAGVVIVGNVTIGKNAIVGPNSTVLSDVPPNTIVLGVPAQVIGPNRRRSGLEQPARPGTELMGEDSLVLLRTVPTPRAPTERIRVSQPIAPSQRRPRLLPCQAEEQDRDDEGYNRPPAGRDRRWQGQADARGAAIIAHD